MLAGEAPHETLRHLDLPPLGKVRGENTPVLSQDICSVPADGCS